MNNAQRRAMFARMNNQTIFFKPKYQSLARKISIENPASFRKSVKVLSSGGLSLKEFRALKLAQARAKATLNRKNLSKKERKQMREITKIPVRYKK